MSGKDDRNDLSGEGAVRPGLTATVALYAPAGSHSRRSLGQSAVIPHAIYNYEYYQRRSPTIHTSGSVSPFPGLAPTRDGRLGGL